MDRVNIDLVNALPVFHWVKLAFNNHKRSQDEVTNLHRLIPKLAAPAKKGSRI